MQAAPPSPNVIPDGTVLDDKFRIERCIGRGGMGAVYEIEHVLTKHRRALKMLYPYVASDRDAVDRFLLEASAAGRIGNSHIVETYDAGWLTSGEPYLVMELLEGEALDERLANQTRVPVPEALEIIAQAARAAHAAHEAGIVHRDLKPENIFLAIDDELDVFVKVLDFGISKFDDGLATTRATKAGAFMGTPQYMSPEQFLDGKRVDRRADVYSLGIILFECITGQHPYPCETLAQLARKIMVEEVPPPSSVRIGVPPLLDTVLARALRKHPDERTPTAEQFARELDEIRTGSKVTLPHGSRWPSELPPPVRDGLGLKKAARTVKMDRAEADASEPLDEGQDDERSRAKTTMKSSAVPRDVAVDVQPAAEEASNNTGWALAAVSAVAIVCATTLWLWPDADPPRSKLPSTERETAGASGADSASDTTPPTAPSGATATSVSARSAVAAPSASVAPKASALPSARQPAPGVSSAPPSPQPKDYADVDEFPE